MPDYRETVEKLRTAASGVCATPVADIQHDADGCCLECRDEPRAHVMRDALTLLTEQEAELARLREDPGQKMLRLESLRRELECRDRAEKAESELATLRAENARLSDLLIRSVMREARR